MSIPTSEPIFSEEDHPNKSARRSRPQRSWQHHAGEERDAFLEQLRRQISPGFDFFLFTLIGGLILCAGILLDSPALYLLAVLLSPFLGPLFAFSLGALIGSGKFFLRELGSFALSGLVLFGLCAAAGLINRLLPAGLVYDQATLHALFAWPDFVVLAVGAGLASYMLIRSPRQKPLVANVALAYELVLPLGVAGFGLTSHVPGLWIDGLLVFLVHLAWAALVGVAVQYFMGLRPANLFGHTLAVSVILLGLVATGVVLSLNLSGPVQVAVIEETATPLATNTIEPTAPPVLTPEQIIPLEPTASATPSIIPTTTPTLTVTPEPTPVWALIAAPTGNGAVVRDEPDGKILTSLLNGNIVQVISEPTRGVGGVTWVQIHTETGLEGWIVQSLLATATPSP